MLADQTIEEMEQQLDLAKNMAIITNQKVQYLSLDCLHFLGFSIIGGTGRDDISITPFFTSLFFHKQ